jgi:Saxitoxin biosynthesis operon protein SxtJ
MQWSDIPRSPDAKTLRQFGGIWVVFFGGAALYQYFAKGHATVALTFAILALTVGPLGLIRPQLIKLIFVSWMILAFPIGWTISTIILAMLYYGIFTPLGLFFRLSGRDLLGLKRRPDKSSYWTPKPSVTDMRRYLREF